MLVPKASVILAAAGAGRRFYEKENPSRPEADEERVTKAFVLLAGRPVLAHTLERFARVEVVAEVIVAVPADRVAWAGRTFGDALSSGAALRFVAGGEDRTASVAQALRASDATTELVAIHDAVRPLIRPAVIGEAFRVAMEHGAAVVGRPVDQTIKYVLDGCRAAGTVPRHGLWMAQTPQVFRREIIVRAYERREELVGGVTDDAQLVEAIGQTVMMVCGDAANLKITTPEDLRLCEALLAAGWPFGEK